MSTIMHPCFESQLIETSQVLKLKVAAPPKATEQVSWSFLESLSNISSNTKQAMEKESIYIHPLSKSTSSRLSDKSLQICTENLGCETGSFMMMDSNILSLSSNNYYTIQSSSRKEHEQKQSKQKVKYSYELPPPLTTMSGEKSLQVKTHRENGRLIIKTIEKPLQESCFLADRSDGRLKLCFLKDVFTKVDMRMIPEENEANEVADNINKNDDDAENDENGEFKNQEDDDDDENEDYNKELMSKEYGGGNSNYDMEKFQRLKRCKQCGNNQKKLGNWEPLWVASS